MNQILNTDLHKNVDNAVVNTNNSSEFFIKKRSFQVQFFLSIMCIVIFVLLYFYSKYLLNKKENFSDILLNNYNISKLYADNSSSTNFTFSNPSTIIGMIEIQKLSLCYPIFSNLDDELLKISPCKFYGEMPPIFSNLCIAGHNYDNSKFFSSIGSLKNNDEILIYNQFGNKFNYVVFNKYEVLDNDLSPIEQDYQGGNELTLITCNNSNYRRIVVKAKIENT